MSPIDTLKAAIAVVQATGDAKAEAVLTDKLRQAEAEAAKATEADTEAARAAAGVAAVAALVAPAAPPRRLSYAEEIQIAVAAGLASVAKRGAA